MTPEQVLQERKLFENWYFGANFKGMASEIIDGHYKHAPATAAFNVWLARAAVAYADSQAEKE